MNTYRYFCNLFSRIFIIGTLCLTLNDKVFAQKKAVQKIKVQKQVEKKKLKTPPLKMISKKELASAKELDWRALYQFNHKTGKGPKKVLEADGKVVKIAGFVVPLSDNYSELSHFILVPDAQSCIHVPPPPPNLIVTVKLRKAIPMEKTGNPTWAIGIFRIEKTESQYGGSAYTLDAVKLEHYEF